jgi:hypothetical protein
MSSMPDPKFDFRDMGDEELKAAIAAVIKSKKGGFSVIPGFIEAMQRELNSRQ